MVAYFTRKRPVSLSDFAIVLPHLVLGLTEDPVLPQHQALLEHVLQVLKVYTKMERVDRLEGVLPVADFADFFVLIGSLAFDANVRIGDPCFEMVLRCLESQMFSSALADSTLVAQMSRHADAPGLQSSLLKLLNRILVTGESELVGQVLRDLPLLNLLWGLFLEGEGALWQTALQTMTALFLNADEPRVAVLARNAEEVFRKALASVSPANPYKVNDDLSILLASLLDPATHAGAIASKLRAAALQTPGLHGRLVECGDQFGETVRRVWGDADSAPLDLEEQ